MKTADPEKWPLLKKEFDAYQGPCIRESPWIRRFYDHVNSYKDPTSYKDQTQFESAAVVEPFGLILEYMDTTLEKVDPELHKRRPQFMKAVFEAQMKGTRDIHQDGLVWTGAL